MENIQITAPGLPILQKGRQHLLLWQMKVAFCVFVSLLASLITLGAGEDNTTWPLTAQTPFCPHKILQQLTFLPHQSNYQNYQSVYGAQLLS